MTSPPPADAQAQRQFLHVVASDEALRQWWAATRPGPLACETVALAELCGRVLSEAVTAAVDVPGFDRSNVDGYAVQAADTWGASETAPRELRLRPERLDCGVAPTLTLAAGEAVALATGGVVPRGADAVVMVEDTDSDGAMLAIRRPVTPGHMIAFAGSDITRGEVLLRPGAVLGPRETGVLAAVGRAVATVFRRPRIAILSTGDELVAPGQPLAPGQLHDCNQTLLADACRELGAAVVRLGIVADDAAALAASLHAALHDHACDLLLISGGTSKGAGDLTIAALANLPGPAPGQPPICVHGVAIKPGKPLCLAATRVPPRDEQPPPVPGRVVPIAVLPGFPTSALFTFHEFVAPMIRTLAGRPAGAQVTEPADLAHDLHSERGRREYVLVQLLAPQTGTTPVALALGKGSGSVTAFCRADGFVAVPQQHERLDAGERVTVYRSSNRVADARDILIIGSHCLGLELLADRLHARGISVRLIAQGSQAGVAAAAQGHCDIAPIHLLDPQTRRYNHDFVPAGCTLHRGYMRMQGFLTRRGAILAAGLVGGPAFTLPAAVLEPNICMVNRNRGSGTRVLIDELLAPWAPRRPAGFSHEARSHAGVAACIAQGRADWGIAIASAAALADLDFTPIREEHYDFLIPDERQTRPAVREFLAVLADPDVRAALTAAGFIPTL